MVADKFYDVIESDDDGDNDFRFNAIIQCVCVCVYVCLCVCVCVGVICVKKVYQIGLVLKRLKRSYH